MASSRFLDISVILFLFGVFLSACQTDGTPCDCEAKIDSLERITRNLYPGLVTVTEEEKDGEINEIVANSVDRDLEDIKSDGILKVLIIYSSTSYFLYKGEPMGFEYELLEMLANHLGLELELVISTDLDSQFEVLNRGNVDLIAQGMTITNQRKWEVDFTEYLFLTRQVLVQRLPDDYRKMTADEIKDALIQDPIQLIDDTVSIRRNSAYYERLMSISNEIGGIIYIDTLDSRLSTDEIINLVENRSIKYTVSDENLAKINTASYPDIDIGTPISFQQRIAWVTRKKSVNLRAAVNEWILSNRKTTEYNVIYNKYFKNSRNFKQRIKSDFYSLNDKQISQYDEIVRKYAEAINWDWRLLASQIYQESRFDPKAKSWVGAIGLMQLMPRTAKEQGISNLNSPSQSIRGGTNYLIWLGKRFPDVTDSLARIQFTLAAYNCGFGHVRDAQRLADARGLDRTVWTDNVESMILALSYPKNFNQSIVQHGYVRGIEPVTYVDEIFQRYEHYRQFIPLEQ